MIFYGAPFWAQAFKRKLDDLHLYLQTGAASHVAEIRKIMKNCCPLHWQFEFRLL